MKRCEIKLLRKTCVLCFERRARFRYRGRVKWDRQHDLCFECFRSVRDWARSVVAARQHVVWPISEPVFVLSMAGAVTIPEAPSSVPLRVSVSLVRLSDSQEACIEQPTL